MLDLELACHDRPLRVLAIGAHCDDVEIGAGGTLAALARTYPEAQVRAVMLTAGPGRAEESRSCLQELMGPVEVDVVVHDLPDSRLPASFDRVKDTLAELACEPWDLVLTHHRFDAHQDHRLLGELAPTAFRDHAIWHFEVPKWDGDLGALHASWYVPLTREQVDAKWRALDQHHLSQRGKDWWSSETFSGLARLRGMECRAPYAEAFRIEKARVAFR